MMSMFPDIGQYVIQFLISVGFAFLIGLEIYTKTDEDYRKFLFGSERTFAFIALLGFVLLKSENLVSHIYLVGFVIIALFLLVYYFRKTRDLQAPGMTTIIIGLLVYTFPLIIEQFPTWFSLLIITIVMVLVEVKTQVKEFSKKIFTEEFLTLAKFVFLSGVILPLVPDREIITGIPVSPYKLWLAIIVISTISYMSYLLRKYVFPRAGLMLAGILGGLYSSTATTFIIARKSREKTESPAHYAAAILAATSMMFLRVFMLVVIFNPALSIHLLPYFAIMTGVSLVVAFFIYRVAPPGRSTAPEPDVQHQNPLELRVALIFGVLYVIFSLLTQYTMKYYGNSGLSMLSLIVGFTDIDPFLLNIFQGKFAAITTSIITAATIQAITSNNFLKMLYAVTIGERATRKFILMGFAAIIAASLLMLFLI